MANRDQYIIWGSGGHSKVLAELLFDLGGTVVALFDNNEVESSLKGVPIYHGLSGFHQWLESNLDSQNISGLVAIGGGRGRDRLEIQALYKKNGVLLPSVKHTRSSVSPSARIGAGSQILAFANVSSEVVVGDACIVNHHASLDHECKIGKGVHIAPGVTLCGCISVGDNVFIGAGAIILPRLNIGEDAVVGAGAVVTRDVPAKTTVVGNPARNINT